MLDFLILLGQAASVLLLIYGGVLVLLPARTARERKLEALDLLQA